MWGFWYFMVLRPRRGLGCGGLGFRGFWYFMAFRPRRGVIRGGRIAGPRGLGIWSQELGLWGLVLYGFGFEFSGLGFRGVRLPGVPFQLLSSATGSAYCLGFRISGLGFRTKCVAMP